MTTMIFRKNKLISFIKDYLPLRLTPQDKRFLFTFVVIFFLLIMPTIYYFEMLLSHK
jgi:hypothetical protein